MEPALAAPHPAEGLTLLAQSSYPLSAFSGLALAASDWSCSLARPVSPGPRHRLLLEDRCLPSQHSLHLTHSRCSMCILRSFYEAHVSVIKTIYSRNHLLNALCTPDSVLNTRGGEFEKHRQV